MIWICQCLCERRHCMIAGAFDDEVLPVAAAERQTRAGFEQMIAQDPAVGRCRICLSRTFTYESGPTHFKTFETAIVALARAQAVNVASGDLLEALRNRQH